MTVAIANARFTVPRPGLLSDEIPYGLLRYGLFTAATGPLDLPLKAIMAGLQFITPYCNIAQCYDIDCPPGSKAASLVGGYTTVTADPFMALAGSECGFPGGPGGIDSESRFLVEERLKGYEQRLVEMTFSRGLCGQAPGLSTSGATQLAAAGDIVEAFGVLERAFALAYGLPGVIHVPLVAMPAVANAHLVHEYRGKWYTMSGNVVSFGNYAGYSAANAAPAADHVNIYITGPVTVWRDPEIFVSPWAESVDKTTNQIHRFAERAWAVAYECTAFAVDVDYTVCC
jgi:hypothetical protein